MTRFLAFIPGSIGDQLLCFPTLDDLKCHYPQAQIDVMVEPRAKGVYRVSRAVNDVLTFNFAGRNGPADWGNLIGQVRDREYDACLYFGQSRWINLLLWLTGVPKRVGYASGWGSVLLTDAIPLKSQQDLATQYHDLLQGFGLASPRSELQINLPAADIEWAESEQTRISLPPEQGYILLCDGGATTTAAPSTYPVTHWQSIVKGSIERQPDLPLLALQTSDNGAWVSAMTNANPNLKVIYPGDLGKQAAIIAGANVLICTGGATLYLGLAVQTYLVALLNRQEQWRSHLDSERLVAIYSPNGNLADIPPIQVLEKVWGH
ncbi:lipopolysaccharide heptosyltransferase family protein [Synechococcales cyanobacterium C]|uniref:Lipopolysaccharide heptosyltransferase family protein n=1 Tax=Petrachloros mirabilis ULC683 TaxID=2781853 RepID=A0A8K2A6J3_9CYAN|nr:glycosyltransferase family 9 protein [Petrachloros mirabilis]NCJ05290.1 lipopolysaccharide heptosyltransferase family protein [Petrachloros mirabilis ULC683]